MKINNHLKLKLLKNNWKKPSRLFNVIKSKVLLKKEKNTFLPMTADIEPTISCNLNCIMCHRKELVKDRGKMSMSLNDFKIILKKIPSLLKINLQGMGEPLLAKDFFSMVREAKKRKILVTTVTNGIFLHRENAKKIIASGIDRVYVSIDSNDPVQYLKYRGKNSLELVKKNLIGLIKERNKQKTGRTLIGIWMLLFNDNVDQLLPLLSFVKKAGIDEITVQTEIKDRGKDNWKKRINDLKIKNLSEYEGEIKKAKKRAKELGVTLRFHRGLGYMKPDFDSLCQWPWKSLYISSDGSIVPCCIISDPKIAYMGNIFQQSFEEIWNGRYYRNLRKGLLKNKIPSYCEGCYGGACNKK